MEEGKKRKNFWDTGMSADLAADFDRVSSRQWKGCECGYDEKNPSSRKGWRGTDRLY
jgi:hypothetical protein